MRVGISKISKELGLKTFQLHKWEERGWLGSEPVLKDPENNNQRVYSEHQAERIRFIHKTITEQRDKGIKRTDFKEMEELLLEKFGGEVTKKEDETLEVLPASVEAFQQLLLNQSKEMAQLRDMVANLQNRELPAPIDHSKEMDEIKSELAESKRREEEMKKNMDDMNEKLQKAVDYILDTEKNTNKSFWKRIFG